MPEVTGPLLSAKAHGSLGKTVTYQSKRNQSRVIRTPTHIDASTQAQLDHRAFFLEAIAAWNALTTEEKAVYNLRATRLNMTGYNLFIKEYESIPPVLVLYEYYNTGDDDYYGVYPNQRFAMVFGPLISHDFAQVRLKLEKRNSPSDLTVEIRPTVYVAPNYKPDANGTALTSVVFPAASIPASPTWVTIDFSTQPLLTAGQFYAIYLYQANGYPNNYRWYCKYSGTYPRGFLWYSANGNTWSSYSPIDSMFEEWGYAV